jgi:hypothetical protein
MSTTSLHLAITFATAAEREVRNNSSKRTFNFGITTATTTTPEGRLT